MYTHFLLPRLPTTLYTFLAIQETDTLPVAVINESLSYYLHDIKHQIHLYEKLWETFKRFTNTYEYIHTVIPFKKYCISKYRPLSRSFFKMIELIHLFGLGTEKAEPIRTFHLAEGPGGFIEALVKFRNRSDDKYVGMTLQDIHNNDYNIPGWKKSQHFLHENRNTVSLEHGCDQTGNILSLDNFVYIHEMYGSSMDLITADGGFDFSTDFDNQEINMTKLLFGQIAYALCMQKQGGSFVLKIFDIFMQHTIDMIALLSSMYEKVYITKPNTSRAANSEKYIVCKGFIPVSSYKFYPYLFQLFRKMLHPVPKDPPSTYIFRIFSPNVPIHQFFMGKLEEYNIIIGQTQIENIYVTLSFIVGECMPHCRIGNTMDSSTAVSLKDSVIIKGIDTIDFPESGKGRVSDTPNQRIFYRSKIQNLIKMNIQKCIQWCIQHNLMYNY
uniref:Ribosomal RNA methyltransferase FtsJ domain-containing protein n=1 Tax=viral metagenome TaxID=1070528 RepID=A0A6C0HUX5_9ZZZZ